MSVKIAINGFGRIGRNVLRSAWNNPNVEFVHINDLTSDEMLAYLLHRDSVHGTWGSDIRAVDGGIFIDGKVIPTSSERDPANLPWADLKVDVVLECTGVFTQRDRAAAHLAAGARKVVISAPGKGVDGTFVYGVNHKECDPSKHDIVSNASCTTNCLAPLVYVLDRLCGVERGLITTIHSYTMDQNLLDAPHPGGKMRRARAAAQNMVPTSTGAAKAIGLVLPSMAGKLNGIAIRVPTANVSIVDLVIESSRDTTTEAVNAALQEAAGGELAGVLGASFEPLVSTDLIGNPHSSFADLSMTDVNGGRMVKVLSWYDNEWGFSNRWVDRAPWMAQ
jgi:glyceraldehyde 3-phosphate dehydrogenase